MQKKDGKKRSKACVPRNCKDISTAKQKRPSKNRNLQVNMQLLLELFGWSLYIFRYTCVSLTPPTNPPPLFLYVISYALWKNSSRFFSRCIGHSINFYDLYIVLFSLSTLYTASVTQSQFIHLFLFRSTVLSIYNIKH